MLQSNRYEVYLKCHGHTLKKSSRTGLVQLLLSYGNSIKKEQVTGINGEDVRVWVGVVKWTESRVI